MEPTHGIAEHCRPRMVACEKYSLTALVDPTSLQGQRELKGLGEVLQIMEDGRVPAICGPIANAFEAVASGALSALLGISTWGSQRLRGSSLSGSCFGALM